MKRKILIPLLAVAIIIAYSIPALNPALNSYAAGELTYPTITISKTTFGIGEQFTVTWAATPSSNTNFLYYWFSISNHTTNRTVHDERLAQPSINYSTTQVDVAGNCTIKVSVAGNDGSYITATKDIVVGTPISVVNFNDRSDCTALKGSFTVLNGPSTVNATVNGKSFTLYKDSSNNVSYNIASSEYGFKNGDSQTLYLRIDNSSNNYFNNFFSTGKIYHSWDSGKITTPATCTENGVRTFTCTLCGATKTEAVPDDGNGHSWKSKVTKAPTCISEGVRTITCSECGESKTETIPATGTHSWGSGKITKAPTCVSAGIRTYTCSGCGRTKTSSIPATGVHKWDSGTVAKAAKYYSKGMMTYTCTKCGKTKSKAIPALDIKKVTPARVKIKSAGVSGTKLTLKWKRIAKNTKGYQVALKDKSTGKQKYIKVKQSKKKILSKTIRKLKKGKTYTVRVRAYNKKGDEIIYGPWSKVKQGKI